MIFRIFLLSFFIFQANAQVIDKYIWPTDASHFLSSSFCEYRPAHYHSAIDIKTWNKEGYPIYAVSNGSIYKIRVSPFGYGKVIYLLLDDGNYAVYAHLQRFKPELERKVRSVQLANRRYTVNWMPDSIRVKQGDLLGYTGQTGIGVPHLHFEIRDPYERPMNPLRFYHQIKDTRAPVLKGLLVIPLKPESRVNNSAVEQVFPLQRMKNNIYKIKGSITAIGPIGLAITGYDQADGVSNKFAFYKTILNVDEQPVFHEQYDFFDFAITNQVDIEIYYPQKAKNNTVYHKLYIEPYNKLPFYDRSLGNGIINKKEDIVNFQIDAIDFAGNSSKVVGTIQNEIINSTNIQILNREKESVYLYLRTPYNLESMEFFTSSNQKNWHAIKQFEIYERELLKTQQQFLIKLTIPDTLQQIVKSVITSQGKELTLSTPIINSSQTGKINLHIENLGESVLLDFSSVKAKNGISLILENHQQKFTIIPEIINDHCQYVIPGNDFDSAPLSVKLVDQRTTLIDTAIHYQKLIPNQYQHISFFNDSVQIISRPQSVYDTLLFDIRKSKMKTINPDLEDISPVYIFNSAYQALRQGIDITIKLDTSIVNAGQIGIYGLDDKNQPELISSQLDTGKNQITGKLEAFGEYFVAIDTVKPDLQVLNLKNNQTLKSLDRIQFKAIDKQAGIGDDRNLKITVDNRFVLPEWDPERDIVTGNLDWTPGVGIHEVVIVVQDMAGNVSTQKITVSLE